MQQGGGFGECAMEASKGFKWTWEPEEEMRGHYAELFIVVEFEDKIWLKWGSIVTSIF